MIKFVYFCIFKSVQLPISHNALRTIVLSSTHLTKCPPKRRKSDEWVYRKRTNINHFFPYVRSWHNIICCDSCGHFHRKWMLCPTCYDQTRFETQAVRNILEQKGEDLSEETVLKYRNDLIESESFHKAARVVNIEDRDRPFGWFNESYWNKL